MKTKMSDYIPEQGQNNEILRKNQDESLQAKVGKVAKFRRDKENLNPN